jgi:transposase-like protein
MIYAGTAREVEAKRVAFLRKWRLRCQEVADSLWEAGDKLFTFLRFPTEQGKSIRTTNAIERLHEAFKRRIKTQWMPPSAEKDMRGSVCPACAGGRHAKAADHPPITEIS